jgi:hypothetical protein
MNKNSPSFIQAIFEHGSSYCLVRLLYVRNSLQLQRLKRIGDDNANFPLDSKLGYIGNFSSMLVSLNTLGGVATSGTYNAGAVECTMHMQMREYNLELHECSLFVLVRTEKHSRVIL